MVISDTRRFVFVHVPRTGGTSVEHALEPYRTTADRTLSSKLTARLGSNHRRAWWPIHATLTDVERKMPAATFDDYFKFGFVRNPFSWLVSRYHFVRSSQVHNRYRKVQRMTFADYVRFESQRWRPRHQHRFLATQSGRLGVDFVGRFERLAEDFRAVCQKLSVETELPHLKTSEHGAYREYYDDQTRALVERHWREDLERFEYVF